MSSSAIFAFFTVFGMFELYPFLIDDKALDQFGIANGTADFLFDLDVIDVDLAVLVDDGFDGLDHEVGQHLAD